MASFNIFRRGSSAMSGILNVLGMAVAFAAFYIILVQVDYDLNFNKGIKDSEKVFVITSGDFVGIGERTLVFNRPLAELIIETSPNIEYGGIMNISNTESSRYWLTDDEQRKDIDFFGMTSMSGTACQALGIETVSGSLDDLQDFSTFAISETAAEKYGLEVGMSLENGHSVHTIKAIFKNLPENSHFSDVDLIWNLGNGSIDNFSEWSFNYFIKVHDPSMISQMEQELSPRVREYFQDKYFGQMPPAEEMGMLQEEFDSAMNRLLDMADAKFISLESLYFTDEVATNSIRSGNRTTSIILLIVAILIVGIAFINYINFFFAQIPEHIRAVNTKKVLGCTRRKLVADTISESTVLITSALILAIALVQMFNMSHLTHLISADPGFGANIGTAVWTCVIALAIAIISSLYPAFYITSFEPALVLKGSFSATVTGQKLRYTLIGIQFIISAVLIICSSFIYLQRRYMVNFDMGFDKEHLLYVHTNHTIGDNVEAVEERLKSNPQIADVTWAAGDLLASERMGWGRDWKGNLINFQCYPVAYDFPEFMGIQITEGRTFLPEDENTEHGVFIFNETARNKYGFTLEDKVNGHKEGAEIAGICKDFSFTTLKDEVSPFALFVFGKDGWYYPNTAFIRLTAKADIPTVMKHIGKVLSEWSPETVPEAWSIRFFDDNINATYQKEKALSELISLFTLVAIIISLMGVFGLVMFETQYRRREIALRRVNGATVGEILAMFCSRFVKIVVVCFVVAAPVSWAIVNSYLATFAHRCPMYWWVFALAFVAVLAVTIGVVVLRSWNAATADPADALKTE